MSLVHSPERSRGVIASGTSRQALTPKKSLPAPLMSGFGHHLTAPCHWQTVSRLLSSPSWWNSSTDLVERTPGAVAHTRQAPSASQTHWGWKQSLHTILMSTQEVKAIPTHYTDAQTGGESNPYTLYWCPHKGWKQSLPTILMPRQGVKAILTHYTDVQTGDESTVLTHYTDAQAGGESSPYPLYWCPGFCLPGGLAPRSWTDPRRGFPQRVSHQQQGTSGAERQAGWWLLLLRLLHCWWMKGVGRAPWQGKHCATHSERSWKLSDPQHWKCNTHRQTHEYQPVFACSCCATDLSSVNSKPVQLKDYTAIPCCTTACTVWKVRKMTSWKQALGFSTSVKGIQALASPKGSVKLFMPCHHLKMTSNVQNVKFFFSSSTLH